MVLELYRRLSAQGTRQINGYLQLLVSRDVMSASTEYRLTADAEQAPRGTANVSLTSKMRVSSNGN